MTQSEEVRAEEMRTEEMIPAPQSKPVKRAMDQRGQSHWRLYVPSCPKNFWDRYFQLINGVMEHK